MPSADLVCHPELTGGRRYGTLSEIPCHEMSWRRSRMISSSSLWVVTAPARQRQPRCSWGLATLKRVGSWRMQDPWMLMRYHTCIQRRFTSGRTALLNVSTAGYAEGPCGSTGWVAGTLSKICPGGSVPWLRLPGRREWSSVWARFNAYSCKGRCSLIQVCWSQMIA